MSVFFFLTLFLSFFFLLSAHNDEDTLLKIKEQLGNPDRLGKWVSGTDYCKSYSWCDGFCGIQCDSDGRVAGLTFRFTGAIAPFPPAICDLKKLLTLDVSYEVGLYGQIPSCIENLCHLKRLIITFTSLSGPIPSSLAQTNLSYLHMPNNWFSGPIPESLSKLKYLNWLDLSYNNLTGSIPPELIHGSPSNSIYLDLSFNNLSGDLPKDFGGAYFSQIFLNNNRLSGDASFMFGKEKATLIIINLSRNNFAFNLSNVEAPSTMYLMDLSYNWIWANIPQSIENIPQINLSNNLLSGPIPTGKYSYIHDPLPPGTYSSFHEAEVYANNTGLCDGPLPPCCN